VGAYYTRPFYPAILFEQEPLRPGFGPVLR